MHYQAWRPTTSPDVPYTHERPLTGMESYFACIGAVTSSIPESNGRLTYFVSPTITYRLSPSVSTEQLIGKLKSVWLRLRYDQPGIACEINAEKLIKTYKVPLGQEELDRWMADTFHVVDRPGEDVDSLFAKLPAPPSTPSLWLFPSSGQLMYRLSHTIGDGLGTIRFFRLLLAMLKLDVEGLSVPPAGQWGDELKRLPPSLEEAIGTGAEGSEEDEEWAKELVERWANNQPASFGPPSTVGQSPPGTCVCTDLVFTTAETEMIVRNAKQLGVGVGAACQAAWTLATMRHAAVPSGDIPRAVDPQQDEVFFAMHSLDTRNSLPYPYNQDDYCANLFFSPWILSTPLPHYPTDGNTPVNHGAYLATRKDFVEMARLTHNQFQGVFKGVDVKSNLTRVGPLMRAVLKKGASPDFAAAPIARQSLTSSLGVVDGYITPFHPLNVTAPWGQTGTFASTDGLVTDALEVIDFRMRQDVVACMATLFNYTIRGRLVLTYAHNAAHWTDDVTRGILEAMRKCLLIGLAKGKEEEVLLA